MTFAIPAKITTKAAAKLIISGDIDLDNQWSFQTTQEVLHELLKLSIEELLQVVAQHNWGLQADVKDVPQFGKIETIIKVPDCFSKIEQNTIDFACLGLCLKNNPTGKLTAHIKYGENHGKTASLIGLTNLTRGHINYSSITDAFCLLDESTKRKLVIRLFFRIPVIQILLKEAANKEYNGYSALQYLSPSTRIRRGSSIKNILCWMHEEKSNLLDERINRIFWEEIGCDQNE